MKGVAKKNAAAKPANGSGTYKEPYYRKDGVPMVKWAISVPIDFVQTFKRFSGSLPLGESGSEWAVKTLMAAIEKETASEG